MLGLATGHGAGSYSLEGVYKAADVGEAAAVQIMDTMHAGPAGAPVPIGDRAMVAAARPTAVRRLFAPVARP